MRMLVWVLLLIAALVLQATLVPLIAVKGIRPDLLLLAVVSCGLLLGKEQGVGVGFFAGLLQDLASGNIFGLNILSKMACGYMAGLLERKVFKENILLPILTILLATLFNGALTVFLMLAFGYKLDLPSAAMNVAMTALYNALLAVPMHRMVYSLAGITPADNPGARK
ncbi:MAG TPA: rod shape-determining protein MreD [Selenomonadales bacterium]|nr:rod shape-determining protein MreD [Selenomonadales bacterium]